MDESFPIRVGANAVVTAGDRLLAVEFDDETGVHYNLPGGGVEAGESVPTGLAREVREETTVDVDVGDLLFVHEYHPSEHDAPYGQTHKLTLFFACDRSGPGSPTLPADPDPNQVGVEWLPIETIEDQPLLPDLGGQWRAIADAALDRRYLDAAEE